MMIGMLLAVASYFPIYRCMAEYGYRYPASFEEVQDVQHVYSPYNPYILCALVWVQTLFVALSYGPMAAFLVELFPTSIRYTCLSLPYHLGVGVAGGLVPVVSLRWIQDSGYIFSGIEIHRVFDPVQASTTR